MFVDSESLKLTYVIIKILLHTLLMIGLTFNSNAVSKLVIFGFLLVTLYFQITSFKKRNCFIFSAHILQ